MINPWNNNDDAFAVMFTDKAEIKSIATAERGSISCCVFPIENIDPFIESDNESNIKSMSILIRKCDWVFRNKPSIGDNVKLPNQLQYKVAGIDEEQNWYRLTCRSV